MRGSLRFTTGWSCCRSRPVLICLSLLFAASSALGQSNPVPFVNQPLVPTAVAPGGPDFTLTVNGTGFVSGATVNWNGTPLSTTFVSSSQLTATVPAANIATIGSASVTVVNPSPGGGVSNAGLLLVTFPNPSVSLKEMDIGSNVNAIAVATADFSGDGDTDIAVLRDDAVLVFLGNGDGTFQPQMSFPTGGNSGSSTNFSVALGGIVAADFNKDGKIDLAVANYQSDADPNQGSVSVLLGNGDGTFQPAVEYSTSAFNAATLVSGDFNGDGAPDLAVVGLNSSGGEEEIFLGMGDGTFLPGAEYGQAHYFPRAAAIYGDGELDLVTAGLGGLLTLSGNGDGTFQQGTPTSGQDVSVTAADFNGGAKPDLAFTSTFDTSVTHDELVVLVDSTPAQVFNVGIDSFPSPVIPTDINGDGKFDLVVPGDNGVFVLLGNGDGTFQNPPTLHGATSNPIALATADFDRDGRVDLAGGNYGADQLFLLMQPSPVDFEPKGLQFGDNLLGTPSQSATVTLSNNLSGPLTVSSITLTGTSTADFTETNNCPVSPSTLGVGGSCTLNVAFSHTTTGTKTAAITVTDDAFGDPQQILKLTGAVVNPTATLSSVSVNFGNQPLNVTSPPLTVTLTNTGIGELLISGIVASGDFGQTNNCGASVAQGASCAINVTFSPGAAGSETGTLTFNDDALGSPQMVSLSGTGVAPTLSLASASVTFPNQLVGTASSPQTFNITNTGPGPASITNIAASGDFSETNNCIGMLAASAACQVIITFNPTAMGTRTGQINLTDDATGSPQAIALTGSGVAPAVALAPASLTFLNQGVGTTSAPQTVTLTNSGTALLNISSIVVNPGFAETNNCGASVSIGTSCTISVTFSPTELGTTLGQLTFTDSALDSPQGVPLTGAAINGAAAAFSPGALSFPPIVAGTPSSSEILTLTNTGNAALNISGMTLAGDFALSATSTTCASSSSVAVGGSCVVAVMFTPTAAGNRTGTLTVTDNAQGSPHMVALSGTGQDFSVAPSQPSATITAGGTATFTISVGSLGGFNQTVNLSCALPAAMKYSTCAVSPTSVTPSSATAATATATITTVAPTEGAPRLRQDPLGGQRPPLQGPSGEVSSPLRVWLFALGLLVIAAICVSPKLRRAAKHSWPLQFRRFAMAVTLLTLLAWAACGGGGGVVHTPGTPAGTYTVTITAADPQANLSQTMTVSVTVNP